MERIGKTLAWILILMAATSVLTPLLAQPVSAEPTFSLSPPEFTVKYVDRSYDVPITHLTTTDPFTGKGVTETNGGYRITNLTIDITIENQPFTPVITDGHTIQLYYTIRAKAHFADSNDQGTSNGYYSKQVPQSASNQTVVTFIIGSENDVLMGKANIYIPGGVEEDFQVEAQAGYLVPDYGEHILPAPLHYDLVSFGNSGWSQTQTITTPNVLADIFYTAIILMVCIIAAFVVAVALVLLFLKRRNSKRVNGLTNL